MFIGLDNGCTYTKTSRLEEYIKPILPHAFILDEPQFANALGFGKVAEVKWQRE